MLIRFVSPVVIVFDLCIYILFTVLLLFVLHSFTTTLFRIFCCLASYIDETVKFFEV